MVPRPRTRPRPPLVVACTSAATAELAAARGVPMLLGMHTGDDGKQEMITRHVIAAARHGHPPASHIGAVAAYVADTRAEARRMLRTQLPRWLGPGQAGTRPATPTCYAGSTRSAAPPTASSPWPPPWHAPACVTCC